MKRGAAKIIVPLLATAFSLGMRGDSGVRMSFAKLPAKPLTEEISPSEKSVDALFKELEKLVLANQRKNDSLRRVNNSLRKEYAEFWQASKVLEAQAQLADVYKFKEKAAAYWVHELASAGIDPSLLDGIYGLTIMSELDRKRLLAGDENGARKEAIMIFSKLGKLQAEFNALYDSIIGEGNREPLVAAAKAFRRTMESNKIAYRKSYGLDTLYSAALMQDSLRCMTSGNMFIQFGIGKGLALVGVHLPEKGHYIAGLEKNGEITHYVETTALLSDSAIDNFRMDAEKFANEGPVANEGSGESDSIKAGMLLGSFRWKRDGWLPFRNNGASREYNEWKNSLDSASQVRLGKPFPGMKLTVADSTGAKRIVEFIGNHAMVRDTWIDQGVSLRHELFSLRLKQKQLFQEFMKLDTCSHVYPAAVWTIENNYTKTEVIRGEPMVLLNYAYILSSLSARLEKQK